MRSSHLAVALLVCCLGPLPAQAQTVTFSAALQVAQNQVPGGQLLFGRTEIKNRQKLYGFYFMTPPEIGEVEVSATGTATVKNVQNVTVIPDAKAAGDPFGQVPPQVTQSLADALKARKGVKLPLVKFLDLALGAVPGTVNNFVVTAVDGKVQVLVSISNMAGKIQTVTIDLNGGKVINVSDPT